MTKTGYGQVLFKTMQTFDSPVKNINNTVLKSIIYKISKCLLILSAKKIACMTTLALFNLKLKSKFFTSKRPTLQITQKMTLFKILINI